MISNQCVKLFQINLFKLAAKFFGAYYANRYKSHRLVSHPLDFMHCGKARNCFWIFTEKQNLKILCYKQHRLSSLNGNLSARSQYLGKLSDV